MITQGVTVTPAVPAVLSVLGNVITFNNSSSQGVLDGGAGNDTITQTGDMREGASILGGDGDDTITLQNGFFERNNSQGLETTRGAAYIGGGAGNDTINLAATSTLDTISDVGNVSG